MDCCQIDDRLRQANGLSYSAYLLCQPLDVPSLLFLITKALWLYYSVKEFFNQKLVLLIPLIPLSYIHRHINTYRINKYRYVKRIKTNKGL